MARQTAAADERMLPLQFLDDADPLSDALPECEHRWTRSLIQFEHEGKEVVEYYCRDCWAMQWVTRQQRMFCPM